jgi:hypothetical protein
LPTQKRPYRLIRGQPNIVPYIREPRLGVLDVLIVGHKPLPVPIIRKDSP